MYTYYLIYIYIFTYYIIFFCKHSQKSSCFGDLCKMETFHHVKPPWKILGSDPTFVLTSLGWSSKKLPTCLFFWPVESNRHISWKKNQHTFSKAFFISPCSGQFSGESMFLIPHPPRTVSQRFRFPAALQRKHVRVVWFSTDHCFNQAVDWNLRKNISKFLEMSHPKKYTERKHVGKI